MTVIQCVCGHRVEADDDEGLVRALRAHAAQAHTELEITEDELRGAVAARTRMAPWDGRRIPLSRPVEIKPLTPDRVDEFLWFFDRLAFMDNPLWASCYCMFFHVAGTEAEWERRTAAQNRQEKQVLIARGDAHGYLAYADGRPVAWCHAAPRLSLPGLDRIEEWRVPDPERVGSVVCFVVAAPYRRQGIARRLLEAAVDGFRGAGLAVAEGYPPTQAASDARSFRGPLTLFLAAGFQPYREGSRSLVVRKSLV